MSMLPGFLMILAMFMAGCTAKPVMQQDIIGHWMSTTITYPPDPIFADTPPDTTAGSALFWFGQGDRFQFRWKDTHLAGHYRLRGRQLVLTGDDGAQSTTCQVKLTKKQLMLIMDDGFVLTFKKDPGAP